MNTSLTANDIKQKLEHVPYSILERVAEYVDALLENQTEEFTISEKQKKILDKALKQDKNTFISRDDITKKYQL
ncbi:MAG: hypothetical protein H6604_00305 [Flavobacteriales bacterium]|nr:hypothetical protein [Flavobacteriales bacterium]